MPSKPNPRTTRLALIAYTDAGDVLQLVSLGTMAKPLPVAALLEHVRERIDGAAVGQVLTFTKGIDERADPVHGPGGAHAAPHNVGSLRRRNTARRHDAGRGDSVTD